MKRLILGGILAVALAGAGCELETRPVAVGVGVDVGPDVYYGRGAYVGSDWVWRDERGHEQREVRVVHERRITERHAQPAAAREPARKEHHEERHEEHR